MARKFRRKTQPRRKTYSYRPTDSMRSEELTAYRRLMLALVLVIAFSVAMYLWGIDTVAFVSSFWRNVSPNSSANQVATTLNNQDETILPPNLDPLPLVTNDPESLRVEGWAQSGVEVEVFVNGESVGTALVDKSGRFRVDDFTIKEGENKIYAVSHLNGMESKPSSTQTILYDKTKPALTVNIDKVQPDGKVQIQGKAEPRATVLVNDHRVIVDLEGNFSYGEIGLKKGDNPIKVTATDEAGNQAVVEKTVRYEPSGEESGR